MHAVSEGPSGTVACTGWFQSCSPEAGEFERDFRLAVGMDVSSMGEKSPG